jgi:Glycosyl transferase 4-like domain
VTSDSYLYVAPDLRRAGVFTAPGLRETSERHHVSLAVPPLQPVGDASAELSRTGAAGLIVELVSGLPSDEQLQTLAASLRSGHRAWMYWPTEEALECVDDERIESLERHLTRVKWLKRIGVPIDTAMIRWKRVPTALRWIYRGEFPVRRSDILVKLTQLTMRAQPLPLSTMRGTGLYVRADYWAGRHDVRQTSRAVAALASASGRAVCMIARDDTQIDGSGVQQIGMDRPRLVEGEDAIVLAPVHYLPILKAACQAVRPAYLYERPSAGESAGAEVSQLLAIPYIVEYHGANALIHEALNGAAPFYPELYAQAEELALRQATVVVAESPALKEELIARGIDGSRVLIAPSDAQFATALTTFVERRSEQARAASIETGDAYKDQVQNQWNQNPVGSQHARDSQPHTLDWFREVERHR